MMDALFAERVGLAFVVAGTFVTLVTILAERFGTKFGGVVASMPTNIVVSMFFIGITQGASFAANAAMAVPTGIAIDAVFLFIYVLAVKKHGLLAFAPALVAWAILIYAAGSMDYTGIAFGLAAFVAATIVLFAILEYWCRIASVAGKKGTIGKKEILARAAFSGGLVASVVVIAAMLGPVWGGLAATFPASLSSSLFLITRSQGGKFAQGFGKVLLFSQGSVVVYVIAVILAFPAYGPVLGTVIAFLLSALFAGAVYPFVKKLS